MARHSFGDRPLHARASTVAHPPPRFAPPHLGLARQLGGRRHHRPLHQPGARQRISRARASHRRRARHAPRASPGAHRRRRHRATRRRALDGPRLQAVWIRGHQRLQLVASSPRRVRREGGQQRISLQAPRAALRRAPVGRRAARDCRIHRLAAQAGGPHGLPRSLRAARSRSVPSGQRHGARRDRGHRGRQRRALLRGLEPAALQHPRQPRRSGLPSRGACSIA